MKSKLLTTSELKDLQFGSYLTFREIYSYTRNCEISNLCLWKKQIYALKGQFMYYYLYSSITLCELYL